MCTFKLDYGSSYSQKNNLNTTANPKQCMKNIKS